tara:strand:- start:112 stop:789 length:678 start_codon:yes stop_codon:yes gene_type:complete
MFEDMYHSHNSPSTEIARGFGVKTNKPRINFSQGSFLQTNGSLDLAIMGEGFFVLGSPLGRDLVEQSLSFTRDGSFQLDREGNVVNMDGLPLLGEGQIPIKIPFKNDFDAMLSEISVETDGEIVATYGLDDKKVIAKINLADFVNEHGLQNQGNSRFEETKESGTPTFGAPKESTLGKLQVGFIETSNTDITDEIVTMLRTQRAFNGCSKILQSEIDITKKLSAR